jgi:Fur family transcriptional regulator, peroxide stress response regulator
VHSISELARAIRTRGGKVTPQRLMIYEELEADTSHPSAEAVFDRIRQKMPTVSLTTVYKTLNELVSIGELRRFDVNGVSHFDPRTDPHAEAVCLRCNTIQDVEFTGVPIVPKVQGFDIVGQTQTLYGYCESCRSL